MRGLEEIVRQLRQAAVCGELWINGSFLTEKLDPNDADLVLRLDAEFYDTSTDEQKRIIDWLAGDLMESHMCDSYVFIEWPQSHRNYWIGEYMYAYWMRQWGFGRDGIMKGIAVVELSGGNK